MNPVEIADAISALAEQPFNAAEFPFQFLSAFGNKETTIRRLRRGESNKSDIGGVLQTNNIHIKTCPEGEVTVTLAALKASPATARARAKFVLATDGIDFEAEDLNSGETIACAYSDFPDKFGFFLPLAGISTVKQVKESSFDVKATGRLNKLYVELLKDNPEWGTADRRHDMNHFMARLIFLFFAEDTDILDGENLFTNTIQQMTVRDSSNTHEVISELFRAMNTPHPDRPGANLPRWAEVFPYVNGGLFSGSTEVPRFSRIARTYLLHIGNLDWKKINPDIFGSMIQAVADDDERGALGMHYTSVPNILKVLNPLFLDDLRQRLEEAGDNPRKLLNLRNRMAKIRVFDPACGSGNFLVIAYKEMRAIEAEINKRRGEPERRSAIPLTNFRGIELRDFPAEIARLALIIAEYQCDVAYRGQREALKDVLPLNAMNWITCGNALRLDWLSICPPTGTDVKMHGDDLFNTPLDQAQIDFENEGGETYICGNPPYRGTKYQTKKQKEDLNVVFENYPGSQKSLDYVSGWFVKAAHYASHEPCSIAFVTTNSVNQGVQVPILWPIIFGMGLSIRFAYTSFKWNNLASHNAGVTVSIVGISNKDQSERLLYDQDENGKFFARTVTNINPYLIAGANVIVSGRSTPLSGDLAMMSLGNQPYEGGYLILNKQEVYDLELPRELERRIVRPFLGAYEIVRGQQRYCLWIRDEDLNEALQYKKIYKRIESVRQWRMKSKRPGTRDMASRPHQFCEMKDGATTIGVPLVSSESRSYLTPSFISFECSMNNKSYALYNAGLLNLSILSSKLHLIWISSICGKLESRLSYSNKIGWNTFPVPKLTEKNKNDLTCCAEDILLAREAHFPATIADLYDPEKTPDELRAAHERNDEVLERIYIGRPFKNDTERLEKLFEMYTKMTGAEERPAKRKAGAQ